MKKIILLSLMCLSINVAAQFIGKEAPTDFELKLNNTNNVELLLRNAAVAEAKKDYQSMLKILEKANKLSPNVPTVGYMLAEAYSLNDKKSKAFNALVELQKLGMYFDIANNENFANISKYPVFDYIKKNMDANNEHFGEGVEVFKIDKSFSGLLFESLAVDDKNLSFLMGSLRDGRVIKIADNGKISTLIEPTKGGKQGPWAALDLAVDSHNDILWVASAAVSQYGKISKESVGLSGVFKYKLSTGKLLKSRILPVNLGPTMIASIQLANNGDVYILESQHSLVLKLDSNTGELQKIFSSTENKNLRSIAIDETARMIYLAGGEKGIVIIDTKNQKSYLIENTAALNLVGISDMVYDDNGLIIVQSASKPERIMRLKLNKTKLVVTNVFPIESAHPRFKHPSVATIFDQGVYFVANSQAAKANNYGGLIKGQTWQDQYVISANKHYNEKETLEYQQRITKEKKKVGAK